jgi:HK97 family phage major capsid protein
VTTAIATRRERLERLVTEMRDFASECDAKDGGASGEDIERLNKMGQDVKTLTEEVKAEAEAMGTLDVAKAFLGDLAGASAPAEKSSPEVVDGIVNPNGMTLGEAFVKSPAYEDFLKAFKGSDGNIRSNVTAQSEAFSVAGFGAKAPITGASSTSGGAFVVNNRLTAVSDLIGERRLTVQDLCTNIQINSDTFEYVTITAKTNNAAGVAEATSEADPAYTTDGSTVTITPNAGGGYKPQSDMTFAVVSEPVETIAHLIPITRRAAADAPQVRQMVDAFLLYGLAEEKEDQILNGNGTSPNLSGILDRSISTVGSAGTDLDAIVDAIRTIRGNNREPNALVVHPNDWYSTGFLLAKDSAGNYLVGDPRASLDQLNSLWGLRVVVTPAMTENTALVGDFRQAVVADRQQSSIYVTDSHKDWFARNLLAVLAEERVGFGVLDVQAFCSVTAV